MGTSRKRWVGVVREKFLWSSPRRETIIVLHNNTLASSSFTEEATTIQGEKEVRKVGECTDVDARSLLATPQRLQEDEALIMSVEDFAATKIQAYFRSHLARRAYRALRRVVKLQAVVRGVMLRRQARLALECMHALARLHLTVQARQLLSHCPTH